MSNVTLDKSKEFAVEMILSLAEDYEARATQQTKDGVSNRDFAMAAILARDLVGRISGVAWGRRIER